MRILFLLETLKVGLKGCKTHYYHPQEKVGGTS